MNTRVISSGACLLSITACTSWISSTSEPSIGASSIQGMVQWTAISETQHDAMIARVRDHSAQLRASSAKMQAAESSACAGLSIEDRDASPFVHLADIASASRFTVPIGWKTRRAKFVGASVVFARVEGLTTERLEQLLHCHLARFAAIDYEVPELPDCPLALPGVRVLVEEEKYGFVVKMRSDDNPKIAQEVYNRAKRLEQQAFHLRHLNR